MELNGLIGVGIVGVAALTLSQSSVFSHQSSNQLAVAQLPGVSVNSDQQNTTKPLVGENRRFVSPGATSSDGTKVNPFFALN